jgi:FKBP-type peptidyl-prolyl cis-trans isomerase FkpA
VRAAHSFLASPTLFLASSKPFFASLMALLVAAPALAAPEIESERDKTFYVIGMLTARPLKMLLLTNDEVELVLKGIRDTARGEPLPIDPEDFASQLRALQEERHLAGLEIESKVSGEYLLAQSKLDGAESTPTGLIFTEIAAGSGSQPTAANKVRVKYVGTLRDGTVFDERTAEFPLSGVIPCWTEGVARVKVGGKARLVCPSELAYGNNGMPPIIPPGAALTFEVELLEILE